MGVTWMLQGYFKVQWCQLQGIYMCYDGVSSVFYGSRIGEAGVLHCFCKGIASVL